MFIDADVNEEFVNKAVRVFFDLVREYDATVRDSLAVGVFIISWALGQGTRMCIESREPHLCLIALETTTKDLFRIIREATKLAMVIK